MALRVPDAVPGASDTRSRILSAAAALVTEGGIAALTTRAVAAAAAVQPPTIYRLFGDKRGLLDAIAEQGLSAYVAGKTVSPSGDDPVAEMRDAFDAHVAFGLANPAVFAIMNEIGRDGPPSPATLAGLAVLRQRVHNIARIGRLAVPEERAVLLIEAIGNGTVATLLARAQPDRDMAVAGSARDAVMAAIVGEKVGVERDGTQGLAIALRSHAADLDVLTPGERLLLGELLDRLAFVSPDRAAGRTGRSAQRSPAV